MKKLFQYFNSSEGTRDLLISGFILGIVGVIFIWLGNYENKSNKTYVLASLGTTIEFKHSLKRVEVVWIDVIATDTGWHTDEELQIWSKTEPDTVTQVGLLYVDDTNYVVLIDSEFNGTGYKGAATKIPRGMIVSVKELR